MVAESPTVTVIIATYNKCSTLRYAIESVLWQTFTDFELWVIGDGCTDDSAQLVTSFNDPRVHWYNLPHNSGYQSEPNNEGLRRATGRYIAYLSHDDLWLPNHLQVLLNCIIESEADLVFSLLEIIFPDGHSSLDLPEYPNAALPPHATVVLHGRELINDIGYWQPPGETYAIPRVTYFRKAQWLGKKLVLAPYLTALMFTGGSGGYAECGPQPYYAQQIRSNPDFAHQRLGALLARAHYELERPVTLARLRIQAIRLVQRTWVKHGLQPERIYFWKKPGKRIRAWRRRHGLAAK